VTTPCTYSQIGELNANLTGLLATQKKITTPFTVHADSAPTVYITGNPARDASVTRAFEQAAAEVTVTNPLNGKQELVSHYMADPVEMKLLHMITADPARTPTFTMFANPDYFVFTGAANCNSPCLTEVPTFAWNHGDVSQDINRTWLGIAGPGVQHLGINDSIWADHTDIRPTMLELRGLKDDYNHDGRVLFETLTSNTLPAAVRTHLNYYVGLARVYKQINAPVGQLALDTLPISTRAMASSSTGDTTYIKLEKQIQQINTQRDALASHIIALLEKVEFAGSDDTQQATTLTNQGNSLLTNSKQAASSK
jgi:hypothetical protein